MRVQGVCVKVYDSARMKFYPYVMCLSAAFLLVTVYVYTCYPKVMGWKTFVLGFCFAEFLSCHALLVKDDPSKW